MGGGYFFLLAPRQECDFVFCFSLQGRFTIAAKHHITIAEIYETELVDIEKVGNRHAPHELGVKRVGKLT